MLRLNKINKLIKLSSSNYKLNTPMKRYCTKQNMPNKDNDINSYKLLIEKLDKLNNLLEFHKLNEEKLQKLAIYEHREKIIKTENKFAEQLSIFMLVCFIAYVIYCICI